MNKDQQAGVRENLAGRVKQAAAVITGDKAKESEGAIERAGGALKKAVGDLKHSLAKQLDK